MSRERITALLQGKPIDRVPLFPFILGFCAKNVGLPISTIYSDPEKSFDAQRKTHEQYGFDWGPIYGYASYGTWEFGGDVKMPEGDYEQAPSHSVNPVQSENDVSKLQRPDVKKAGCLPKAMEFSQLQDKFNTPITVQCGGIFTIAGNICPVELLCRWMLRKSELVHQILRLATDHIVDVVHHWTRMFAPHRVIPQIWEPLTTNHIISPRQFETFVFPYLLEASSKMLAMGVKHLLFHICGEQNGNLPYWAQVPVGDPGLCSFGKEVEMTTAIEYFGEKNIIIGNIDPQLIQYGSPQKVYTVCRETIEQAKHAPRGYMMCSGCEIPPNSPPYNVYLMGKAANDAGRYE